MTGATKPYEELKVLLIDDESGTRRLIKNMLFAMGIRSVAEAANGMVGYQELLRTHPDIILCDVHMAPIDGQNFLMQVRDSQIEWVRGTPVIFLTADSSVDTVLFAKQYEIDGYLVKPVSKADLKRRIDMVRAGRPTPSRDLRT